MFCFIKNVSEVSFTYSYVFNMSGNKQSPMANIVFNLKPGGTKGDSFLIGELQCWMYKMDILYYLPLVDLSEV